MSLEQPYLDVPGTTIFDAEQSRLGYYLNQFCMSLMKAYVWAVSWLKTSIAQVIAKKLRKARCSR